MPVWNLRARIVGAALLALLTATAPAGAVSMDKSSSTKDRCEIMLGGDAIQIGGYLPDVSRDRYCADFPATGRVILSFDLVAPRLRDLPIEVRIIRDPLTPLAEDADLDPLTVAYLAPRAYPSGTFTLDHVFRESGHYIGLVTIVEATGERRSARFAFSVGQTLLSFAPMLLGGALIAGLLFVYWRHSASKQPR